jgi:hypothetical protein
MVSPDVWLSVQPGESRTSLNAAAKICRLDRHEDLHLRRDLQHQSPTHKLRATAATSVAS